MWPSNGEDINNYGFVLKKKNKDFFTVIYVEAFYRTLPEIELLLAAVCASGLVQFVRERSEGAIKVVQEVYRLLMDLAHRL